MDLKVIRFVVGGFGTNSYLLLNENNKGFIIDPGANGKEILEYIKENKIDLDGIILTHGHGDHIGAVPLIVKELNIPVYIHSLDSKMLADSYLNLTGGMGMNPVNIKADNLLEDGSEIHLEDKTIKAIHTPGHTPGGICLYVDNILFSGDTLFELSIGRTDFPGGDYGQIINSINSLMVLPEDTVVYPGHGAETTLGYEKKMNPFLK